MQSCKESDNYGVEVRFFRFYSVGSRKLRAFSPVSVVFPSIARSHSSTSSGFTLLEIMVALAILSLGIVTVLELLAGSLNLGVKASRHTQAAIYAQNIMDRAFAQNMLDDGEERGEFPDGYTWVARVREVHPDDDSSRFQSNQSNRLDFFHLKEIEVQIAWDENGGEKTFVVRSLRAQTEQPNAQVIPN